jgi:hypothetical protein
MERREFEYLCSQLSGMREEIEVKSKLLYIDAEIEYILARLSQFYTSF